MAEYERIRRVLHMRGRSSVHARAAALAADQEEDERRNGDNSTSRFAP